MNSTLNPRRCKCDEGDTTFRVREDGSSGIIEYGYKFRPVIE